MKSDQYQKQIVDRLRLIFNQESVRSEWDSVQYDGHTGNHKMIYAPRIDIAVGPFNSHTDIDLGADSTKVMHSHIFTKRLVESSLKYRGSLDKIWNGVSRCYLAIEIEFNGSSKHLFGSIINASVSGSIGIVIVNQDKLKKAERICNYIFRLEDLDRLELNGLKNLIIFERDDFLNFLSKIKKI